MLSPTNEYLLPMPSYAVKHLLLTDAMSTDTTLIFLLLSMICPMAVLGLQISMLSLLAELCLASWIVKISVPSNILSLIIGIVNFATLFRRLNLTFLGVSAKSNPPVSH